MELNKNKPRALINLIGVPSLLAIIYYGELLFTSFIYIVIFLCTKELYDICKQKEYSINIIWLCSIYILMYVSHCIDFSLINAKEVIIFLLFLLFISQIIKSDKKPLASLSVTLFIFIWIALFLDCAIYLRNIQYGRNFMYCIFLSVWMCDSAAYIFGSKFGKAKILPDVSPNKTWLGTFSGYLFSSILIYLFVYFDFLKLGTYLFTAKDIIIIGIIVGVIGQTGDFFESMIKREFEIKDSGTLLQGHGGVLDRFDSLLFVFPAFYLYIEYIL